jgi:hypothetical protein
VDSSPQNTQALADLARAFAARRLGRVKLPVRVVVSLSDSLDLESIQLEVASPPPSDNGDGVLAARVECVRDVQAALVRAGHRLTTTRILAALDKAGADHSETAVKRSLAWAADVGLLTKAPDADPPGYGLPGWD